ncbi:hypothetical protein DV735_g3302, partial [Chaetothyriales sp. CBS 134920]
MTRIAFFWATLLPALLAQASAQLLSCSEIDCPTETGGLTRCNVDNTTLVKVGVANFSSSLSPTPLTWTVGLAPEIFTADGIDQRRYYLGTPPELDLSTLTDITGCALFFVGIEASLVFPGMDQYPYQKIATDTCADALGSTCVEELTNQTLNLVPSWINSTNAQCSDLAQALQSSPPESCTSAGNWGNITAKAITGSDIPPILERDDCTPTTNATYDLRNIATTLRLRDESLSSYITPLMTIFASNGDGNETGVVTSPEVHLNCMKPMQDLSDESALEEGGGQALVVWKSLPSMCVALPRNVFATSTKLPDRTAYTTTTQQSFAQSAYGRRPDQPSYAVATQVPPPPQQQHGPAATTMPPRHSMEKEPSALSELTEEQRDECQEAFQLFDLDRDKFLSYHELRVAMRALGFNLPKPEIAQMLRAHGTPVPSSVKTSESAPYHVSQLQISQAAFMKLAAEKVRNRDPAHEVERAYNLFDNDRKGFIVVEDLRRVARELGETGLEEDEMVAMIEEFDFEGTGTVAKEAFYAICLQ